MSGEDERVKIWFGPDRYSRRLREQTGMSPFLIAVKKIAVKKAVKKQGREEARPATRAVPPREVAERLGIRPSAEVIQRETRYFVDDQPVQCGVTYIPTGIAEGMRWGEDNLYAHLEEKGWPVARIREEVTARMPTPDEAKSLGITEQIPVIEVTHTSMDDWKRPFEVTRFVMRADRAGLDYEIPIED
jgi:GntR family transcriptional regulator